MINKFNKILPINFPIVIPAAGLGSRLFPATWGIPKELFPLGNKPALHYILEEALIAGINNVLCVTSPRKEALTTYLSYKNFNNNIKLTKDELFRLTELDELNSNMNYEFLIQEFPKGVSDAILCVEKKLENIDYFCMAYPDDIILNLEDGLLNLINYHNKYNCSVILVEKVPNYKISSYGVIKFDYLLEQNVFNVVSIIEKPSVENAPSEFGVIARYVLSVKIVKYMKEMEYPCFISAMNKFIQDGEKIIAISLNSPRYDIGNVAGWIEAVNAINANGYIKKNIDNNINMISSM